MEEMSIKEYEEVCRKVNLWWRGLTDVEKIMSLFEIYKVSQDKEKEKIK